MINRKDCVLYIPNGLRAFKLHLFNRIGEKIGSVVRGDVDALRKLPPEKIPIVGCSPELTQLIAEWRARKRRWIYWDRGYFLRVFATDLERGDDGGYYRWHVNSYQLQEIGEHTEDRWLQQETKVHDWRHNPDGHIVIAAPSPTYEKFHGIEGWVERTVEALTARTKRKLVVRTKEMQRRASDHMPGGRRLWDDVKDAHCLVTHGSNAAVEAVIMGCPVFVHPDSAAALVGQTDLDKIEEPIYPDRQRWLYALADSQFNEKELVDGTLWRHLQ